MNRQAYLKNITAMLIFGSIGLFVKAIPLASSEIGVVRGLVGSLFLLGVFALSRRKVDWASVRAHLGMLVLSGSVLGLNMLFLFMAYKYTTVSIATILYYCAPIIVMFVSPFLLGEHLSWPKVVGIGSAIVGMVMISGTSIGGSDPAKGMMYGLLAAVFYASVVILNKRVAAVPAVEKTAVQLLSAALVMAIYSAFNPSGGWSQLDARAILALLLIGFIHTGLAYLLYFSSLADLPAQSVALASYLDPASALIFSAIFLGERLSLTGLLGAALILGGSAFGELVKREN